MSEVLLKLRPQDLEVGVFIELDSQAGPVI